LLERLKDDALFFRGNADSGVSDLECDHRCRVTKDNMAFAPAAIG
jgi:hypothetical protein